MKITTTVEAMLSALKLLMKPEKKTSIPILANVHVMGNTLSTTTLDVWSFVDLQTDTPVAPAAKPKDKKKIVAIDDQPKGFIFPYYQTLFVLNGETGPLTVEYVPAKLDSKSATSHVLLSFAGCEVKLDSLSASNWPPAPSASPFTITVDGEAMKTVLDRTMFAISKEESRYTLNGAQFSVKDSKFQIVATDGHRLSIANTNRHAGTIDKTLVSREALEVLKPRIGSEVKIGVSTDAAYPYQSFQTNGVTILSRVLTGEFPNYEAVIPKRHNVLATIPDASKLLATVTRVAKCADERSQCIKLSFAPELTLSASSSERGSMTAKTEIVADGLLSIGLNADMLTDFLKRIGPNPVAFKATDAESAILLSVDDFEYIQMPMRL